MASVNVPRSYIDGYVDGLHRLDEVGRRALASALERADLANHDRVRAIMRVHCNATAQAAADMSAQFYRGLSLLETGEDVDVEGLSGYDATATDVATSAILRDAADGETARRQLLDRMSYEANRASKLSAWANGQRDSRQVRYARVPSGAETCAWCLMTAGLGYWFMSEESASHTHRGCDCVIVAEIGGIHEVHIDGYDSDALRDMWRSARARLENGDVPQEVLDRINAEKARKGRAYRMDTNGVLAVMRHEYGLK